MPIWQNLTPPRSPPALSVQLKEKRDAAILELHKEGKSFREIDKALGLGNDTARKFITANEPPKNVSVTNFGTPEVSTSAVPMASTEDRSETREDASS